VLPDLGLAVAQSLDLDAIGDPARTDAFLSGQCLLVRRDAYEAVGGFGSVRDCLVEDLALARRLKAAGHRIQLRLAPDLVSVRMYRRPGDAWQGLARSLADVWGTTPGAVAGQAARAFGGWAPWAALALRPGARPARALALLGGALHLAVRAGGRAVAGADPRWAVGYPVADGLLLAVYLDSVSRRRRGAPVRWRGRSYPASAPGSGLPGAAATAAPAATPRNRARSAVAAATAALRWTGTRARRATTS